MERPARVGRTQVERLLDAPERALLSMPWPATARIILKGSLGFVRQLVRSRALGLRAVRDDGSR